jgi:hypothetical protein
MENRRHKKTSPHADTPTAPQSAHCRNAACASRLSLTPCHKRSHTIRGNRNGSALGCANALWVSREAPIPPGTVVTPMTSSNQYLPQYISGSTSWKARRSRSMLLATIYPQSCYGHFVTHVLGLVVGHSWRAALHTFVGGDQDHMRPHRNIDPPLKLAPAPTEHLRHRRKSKSDIAGISTRRTSERTAAGTARSIVTARWST